MYLIKKLARWDKTELASGSLPPTFRITMEQAEDGSIGYLEVFDDYDKALVAAGSPSNIIEIAVKE